MTIAHTIMGLVVAFTLVMPASALAVESAQPSPNDPTSGELVVDAKKWDGKSITFTGEVIAGAQERGDFAWIHVNDDAYYLENVEEGAALGGYNSGHAIWLPADLTEQITFYGDHGHEGDVVTVMGTFNAACGQHGGDMDIHADSLEVAIVGREAEDPVRSWKVLLALGVTVAAGAAWAAHRNETRIQRRGGRS